MIMLYCVCFLCIMLFLSYIVSYHVISGLCLFSVCSIDAVYKVQDFLHQKQPAEALAFIRAARSVQAASLFSIITSMSTRDVHVDCFFRN